MPRRIKNIVQLLALSICWITVHAECWSAEKAGPGYDIIQKSLMVGNVTVRVYPKAVQVTDHGKGIVYLSRAPSWMLEIINPRAKTFYECKVENFSGAMNRGVALFTGRVLTDVTYDMKPTKEPDGLLQFTSDAEYTKRETEMKKNVKKGNGLPKVVDVFVNPSILVPPQAVTLVSRLYGFSEPKGMPVRVRFFDYDHTEKVFLSTSSFVKKALTENDFEKRLPTYKRVPNINAVYRSQEQDDAVGDMLQGMETELFKSRH
jgi:hypothetical protein